MGDRTVTTRPSMRKLAGATVRRRGMLAAVAALAAGGLAKTTAGPALAGTDGDLVLNTTNNATASTKLQVTPGLSFPSTEVLFVDARNNTRGVADGLSVFGSNGGTIGIPGVGIRASGGIATFAGAAGGIGVIASGGDGGPNSGAGGPSVLALGGDGTSPNGSGGDGVDCSGGSPAGTGAGGIGVRTVGGGSGATGASGVLAINNSTTHAAVSGQNNDAGDGVFGNSGSGIGVHGSSSGQTGVYGNSNTGVGARGDSGSGPGVIGTSTTNNGVFGLAGQAGNGVFGQTASGNGVLGQATSGGNGVQGLTTSGTGVFGSAGAGSGVFGTSVSGAGVAGSSANNNALFGDASAAGNGVFARTANGNGLVAQATGGGNAAQFFGNVIVQGNFTVAPGFAKSGSVAFPDGSVRRLYATEAPESWFEDYGEAQLVNGRASVPIPADFALAVNTSAPYYVFTESHSADVEALAVVVRAPDHFEVQANGKGLVEGSFAYRIVAKRKDVPGPRFERVTLSPAPSLPAQDAAMRAPVAPVPVKLPDLPAGAQQIPPVLPVPAPPLPPSKPGR